MYIYKENAAIKKLREDITNYATIYVNRKNEFDDDTVEQARKDSVKAYNKIYEILAKVLDKKYIRIHNFLSYEYSRCVYAYIEGISRTDSYNGEVTNWHTDGETKSGKSFYIAEMSYNEIKILYRNEGCIANFLTHILQYEIDILSEEDFNAAVGGYLMPKEKEELLETLNRAFHKSWDDSERALKGNREYKAACRNIVQYGRLKRMQKLKKEMIAKETRCEIMNKILGEENRRYWCNLEMNLEYMDLKEQYERLKALFDKHGGIIV